MRISPTWRTVAEAPSSSPAAITAPSRGPVLAGEQDRDAGDDQGLEPDVGHDVLLDLDLVGVEQYRGDGDRREPARCVLADQDDVDRTGHGQAEQVLDGGDGAEVADREYRLERRLVPDRVGSWIGVVQVLDRVDVEQGRMVRELCRHAQREPGGYQDDQQPVSAGSPPRGPRHADERSGRRGGASTARLFAHGA